MNEREKYWHEEISCQFEDAGIYDVWNGLPEDTKASFVKGVALSHEMYDEFSGRYEQHKGSEDPEVKRLKEQVAFYQKEAEDWEGAFRKNVMMRRGIRRDDGATITLSRDGSAEVRY